MVMRNQSPARLREGLGVGLIKRRALPLPAPNFRKREGGK